VGHHAQAPDDRRAHARELLLAAHPACRDDRPDAPRALGRQRLSGRLAGEDIPLEGRICAVCDVFDALLSTRCYKPAWPLEDVLAELERQRGSQFDPELVDVFLTLVPQLYEELYARPEAPFRAKLAEEPPEAPQPRPAPQRAA
jgi:hypothetical protein